MLIRISKMNSQLLFVIAAIATFSSCNGRPSNQEDQKNSQNDLENGLDDMIVINAKLYLKKPKPEMKKDPVGKETKETDDGKELKEEIKDTKVAEKEKEKQKEDNSDEDFEYSDGEDKVIEGDLILTPRLKELRSGKIKDTKRNIISGNEYKWPNNKYYYHLDSSLTPDMQNNVRTAITTMSRISCIESIEKKDKHGYVLFKKSPQNSCNSAVGKSDEQPQHINVATWCTSGALQHEILHSLGFLHEQSRPDRDNYVTIMWKNIKKGVENNFKKYSHPIVETYKEPYDYGSIMHYSRKAFSVNGKDTIVPKGWFKSIGQRTHLSDMDKTLLNKHYGCRKCENEGWGCFARRLIDSCDRAKSHCLGSCGMYCKA